MEPKTWTRTEIEEMINTHDRAVERAMVAIWERQTADEQETQGTRHHNGRGFASTTARACDSLAGGCNTTSLVGQARVGFVTIRR
jgi:hypothetical protein